MSKKQEGIKIKENLEKDKTSTQIQYADDATKDFLANEKPNVQVELQEDKANNLTAQLEMADKEKVEIEKKYSVATDSLEKIAEQDRQNNILMIQKLYAEGMALYRGGEKELAIAKLQEGVAIDSTYYLAWFGLLQVHTDNLQDLKNIEELAEIYDNSIFNMDDQEKLSYAKEYLPQLQQKIETYRQIYQELEREDEKVRQEYQPRYNQAWQKCKPIFWILLVSTVLFSIAMSVTWPFLYFVSGQWIAYLAIIFTVFAGVSLILFLIFSARFAFLYNKKNFCARSGNSIYGEDMRKIAQECEKYQILLEDLTVKAE